MSPPTEAAGSTGDNVIDIGVVGTTAPPGDRRQHPGPGYWLRQARERRGWSQKEAADMLNLSPRFLVSMEEETFDKLPAPAFARGYLRAYSRLLNLSGDEIMRRYESVVGDDSDPYFNALRTARQQPVLDFVRAHPGIFVGALGALAALLLMLVIWWGWGLVRQQGPALEPALDALGGAAAGVVELGSDADTGDTSDTGRASLALPPAAAGSDLVPVESEGDAAGLPATGSGDALATPAAAGAQAIGGAAAAVAAAAVAGATTPAQANLLPPGGTPGADRVELSVAHSCWVDVRDATGGKVFSNNVAAGASIAVSGTAPFTVVLGNAPGARVTVNGKPVDVDSYIRGRVATLIAGP